MTMKRYYLYIIMASLAMFTMGCQTEPADVLQAEPDYANLTLSSRSVVLAADECVKTVFVATNREELQVDYKEEWIDVSVVGNALTLYVEANNSGTNREAVVDVVAGEQPDVAKARLRVVQTAVGLVDLSAEGTANCYVALPNGSYCLDASIKGNGGSDGNSRYIEFEGLEIEGASYADLAWEATYDGDKTRSTKIISGAPIYSADDQKIYFATGESEGNALVSLHSADGTILWSWHIWVTSKEITTSLGNGLQWMDRNLGALTNEIGDVANRGMLYQWGRKEPFLPSSVAYMEVPTHTYDEDYNLLETEEEYYAIEAEIEAARVVLNVNNEQRGDGYAEWHYVGEVPPVALAAPGNVDYALQHPTTFLGCRTDIPIGEYVFDWYLQQDLEGKSGLMQQSASNLWGDSEKSEDYKTIFDPCPVGYVVPPTNAFASMPLNYACTYLSEDWTKEDYGWTWTYGNGDYFPSSGNFDVSGLIGETSEKMLYWTAQTFGYGYQGFGKSAQLFVAYNDIFYGIYPLLDESEAGSWYSYGARCIGASVRCVKEQK